MNAIVQHCGGCGNELPPQVSPGLCPRCALENAADLAPDDPRILPRSFGDYELLEEVARGGMGIVYRARQKSLNRIVALKMILSGQFAGNEEVLRFRAEAESAARLQHPNIVRIHETGEVDGQPYFSMDYVEGQNLSELVREQPLNAKRAAAYVKKIAEAIHYAHEQGILHRDLKPSNVLLDAEGQPHVTDFGLARQLDGESSLTLSGQVLGSPNYMPPEQAQALRDRVSRRSDVYGLGAVLYYSLTARPPFQGGTIAETVHQVLNQDPVSPRAFNPEVPPDIETICLRCLEKNPDQRYATAQELSEELERFIADEPIHARPVGWTERARRWCRKNPAIAALAALFMLTALTAGTGWLVARERGNAAVQALIGKTQAEASAQEAKQKARQTLRNNSESFLRRVATDTNNAQSAELLADLSELLEIEPLNYAYWQARAIVLERSSRFEEAIAALSKALTFTNATTNTSLQIQVELLLARSELWHRLNELDQAHADYLEAGRRKCMARNIPLRTADTDERLLDLSPFFASAIPTFSTRSLNGKLVDASRLRQQVRDATGIDFDVRGGLDVWTSAGLARRRDYTRLAFPSRQPLEAVIGIPVNRHFLRLHALHSVWGTANPATKVASYILHYRDGRVHELPIRYGEHVRDLWGQGSRSGVARLAWRGERADPEKHPDGVNFFHATWENPFPEAEVISIDLAVPPDAALYPILLALTIERPEPGTLDYWTFRAAESEKRGTAEALGVFEEASRNFPSQPRFWTARGKMLERARRTNDAVEAYSSAISIAAANEDNAAEASARRARAKALVSLRRISEAGSDNCKGMDIPLRDSNAPAMIDLSAFYNVRLDQFLVRPNAAALAEFADAVQKEAGLPFDIRAYLGAYGGATEAEGRKAQPAGFFGIPIGQKASRVHIIHFGAYTEAQGKKIGAYVFHYEDGRIEELPITYGRNILPIVDKVRVPEAQLIAIGPTAQLKRGYFHKVTWENPHRETKITSVDFVSTMTVSSPRLLAMTVE